MKRILVRNSNLSIHLEGKWIKFSPYKVKVENEMEGTTKEFMLGSYITDDEKIIEAIQKTSYFVKVEEFQTVKEKATDLKKK